MFESTADKTRARLNDLNDVAIMAAAESHLGGFDSRRDTARNRGREITFPRCLALIIAISVVDLRSRTLSSDARNSRHTHELFSNRGETVATGGGGGRQNDHSIVRIQLDRSISAHQEPSESLQI